MQTQLWLQKRYSLHHFLVGDIPYLSVSLSMCQRLFLLFKPALNEFSFLIASIILINTSAFIKKYSQFGIPTVAQQVKGPALYLQQLRLLLRYRFDSQPSEVG